jgi:hypothetical protein
MEELKHVQVECLLRCAQIGSACGFIAVLVAGRLAGLL